MTYRIQEQVLVPRQSLNFELLDKKAGIVSELTDPFNLFLDMDDIVDKDRSYVYFIVYTFGKKKLLVTGLYDKSNRNFIIDTGCRYDVRQLANLIKGWKGRGYRYVGNMVLDRAQKRFDELLPDMNATPNIPNYQAYRKLKYLIPYLKRDYSQLSLEELKTVITSEDVANFEEQVEDKYKPRSVEQYMDGYYEYIEELEDQVKVYEEKINRYDVDKAINEYAASIVAEFTRFLLTSDLNSSLYYDELYPCPTSNHCQDPWKYIPECSLYYHGEYPYLYVDDISKLR